MTDEDETPLDALIARLNDDEREAEREDAAHAFVRALFGTAETTDRTDQGDEA